MNCEQPGWPDVQIVPLQRSHAPAMFRWMCDAEVRDNVGVRREPSLAGTEDWLEAALADASFAPMAIMWRRQHVGNVILDRIERTQRTARLSIYIGESAARGRGVGSRALQLALQQAFEQLELNSVWLTVHGLNSRAIGVYRRAGFVLIGISPGEFALGSQHVDEWRMEIFRREFQSRLAAA